MSALTRSIREGHSADVRMTLRVNGKLLDIAQMGPDFLILRQTVSHPPSDAEVTLVVDGHEERWNVRLPDGLHGANTPIRVARS